MVERDELRVRGFRVHRLSVPLPRSYASGMHDECTTTENVLLELDAGPLTGHGRAFAFVPAHADAIRAVLVDLVEGLLGDEVGDVAGISERLLRRTSFVGAGVARMAIGVVDTALWDLVGQRAGLPLFRLYGGSGAKLRAYASGGWLTYTERELVEEAAEVAELGYAGYKMKLGHADWSVDVARVEHVLGAVAGRIPVMVDANQAWTTKEARAAGIVLASLGVDWLEEPVPAERVADHARLTEVLALRVATGESLFTVEGFKDLVEQRAADVVMPNVVRIGGPTRMAEVIALARASGRAVSPHVFHEVSGHVLAGHGGGDLLEHIPGWWDGLFEGEPRIARGQVQLSTAPGLGYRFSERAIAEWSCDEVVTGRADGA